jgi:hypothetical protein
MGAKLELCAMGRGRHGRALSPLHCASPASGQGYRIGCRPGQASPLSGLAPSRDPVDSGRALYETGADYWIPALATRAKPGSLRLE